MEAVTNNPQTVQEILPILHLLDYNVHISTASVLVFGGSLSTKTNRKCTIIFLKQDQVSVYQQSLKYDNQMFPKDHLMIGQFLCPHPYLLWLC